MRILILCTGNSCRSQMAEGFLKSFDSRLQVYSAGTAPAPQVHPKAIQVMQEMNINLNGQSPQSVDQFLNESWDYVITVCGDADENCPAFYGNVQKRLHIGFNDPAKAIGSEEEVLSVFRKIRDEIKQQFHTFYEEQVKPVLY